MPDNVGRPLDHGGLHGDDGSDWVVQTADTIENLVDKVRSKTTDPLVGVARWIVYGLLAAIVGAMALLLLVIGLVRMLDAYLPSGVWFPDVLLGGILTLLGLLLWSKRRPRDADE